MKKIIIFILLVLFVSGCTASYNLEIKKDSFIETINVVIEKDEIPEGNQTIDGIELNDQITPFLNGENPVFFSDSSIKYNKNVEEILDYYKVTMDFEYIPNEFRDSNSLNACFSDFELSTDENYYIHAYGEFYCLYSDVIKINIQTDNEVIKNNAHYIKGNTYTWEIDSSNVNDIDIELEVGKNISYRQLIVKIILGICFVALCSVIIFIINKKRQSNKL